MAGRYEPVRWSEGAERARAGLVDEKRTFE